MGVYSMTVVDKPHRFPRSSFSGSDPEGARRADLGAAPQIRRVAAPSIGPGQSFVPPDRDPARNLPHRTRGARAYSSHNLSPF